METSTPKYTGSAATRVWEIATWAERESYVAENLTEDLSADKRFSDPSNPPRKLSDRQAARREAMLSHFGAATVDECPVGERIAWIAENKHRF